MFFILMIIVVGGINFYVFNRLLSLMPQATLPRIALIVFGITIVSAFFANFLLMRTEVPSWLAAPLYQVGTAWFFISFYLFMAVLLVDILRLVRVFSQGGLFYHHWAGFGIVVGVVAVIMIAGYLKYENKERVELNLTVDKNGGTALPLKIVALSDLHLGYNIRRGEFERWAKLINKENPDIVLIAGDLIDNNVTPVYEEHVEEVFAQIKSKYGIYAVPGNHEYISGMKKSREFLEKAGIHLLRDKAVLVDNSFYIVGRDDKSSHERESDLAGVVDTLDQSKPIIVLDHQPYELEQVERNHIDLQLSGHTHRGQVWPVTWITDAIYEKAHGYLKKGNSHIYVSSGIGIWGGKFRIGSQSEYIVINLSTASKD